MPNQTQSAEDIRWYRAHGGNALGAGHVSRPGLVWKINAGVFIGCSRVVLQYLEVIRSEYLSSLLFRSFAMLILWAWCCLCFAVMCYFSWTLEQGEERGICILSMQCLQISHPCIIIYAAQEGCSGTTNSTYSLWKLKSIISQSDQPLVFTPCFMSLG